MNVVFASNSSNPDYYNKIFEKQKKKIVIPTQKFFKNLIDCFVLCDCKVFCITMLPISRKIHTKLYFKKKHETISDKLSYFYLPFINIKFIKQIMILIGAFFAGLKYLHKDSILVVDSLAWPISIPLRLAAKIKRVPSVAFVTDLPKFSNAKAAKKRGLGLIESILSSNISKYDAYILVTSNMSNIVNKFKRPEVVIEGVMDDVIDSQTKTNDIPVFTYAGAVYRKYGIDNLVSAFEKVTEKAELHIYGDGDYVEEIINNNNKNIFYKGCVNPSEVFSIEQSSDFLVNPRPTNEEYTKYSFPSKTIEYLSTGKVVLSTRLPGISSEYEDYLLWFDGYDSDSILAGLNKALEMSEGERKEFGHKSKTFCENRLSKKAISCKIYSFFSDILKERKTN